MRELTDQEIIRREKAEKIDKITSPKFNLVIIYLYIL